MSDMQSEALDRVSFRCPAKLLDAVDAAAGRELITRSDYARRAVLRQLQADGVLDAPQGAAA